MRDGIPHRPPTVASLLLLQRPIKPPCTLPLVQSELGIDKVALLRVLISRAAEGVRVERAGPFAYDEAGASRSKGRHSCGEGGRLAQGLGVPGGRGGSVLGGETAIEVVVECHEGRRLRGCVRAEGCDELSVFGGAPGISDVEGHVRVDPTHRFEGTPIPFLQGGVVSSGWVRLVDEFDPNNVWKGRVVRAGVRCYIDQKGRENMFRV